MRTAHLALAASLVFLAGCRTRSHMMPPSTCSPGPVTIDPVAPGKTIEYTGVSLVSAGLPSELCQLYRFNGFRYPDLAPPTASPSDFKVLLCSRGVQARAHIHHSEEALVMDEGVVAAIGVIPVIYVRLVRLGSSSSTLLAETCPEGDYLYFVRGHGTSPTARVTIDGSSARPVILTPGQYVLVTNPSTSPVIGTPQNIAGDEHAMEFVRYMERRANAAGLPFNHDGGWGSAGGSASLSAEPKPVEVVSLMGATAQ